ncbi:hypothetical protein B0O99DRAFT_10700 [Bisporella sp. PMI_857]|nr:hypothetical protein B0O99DRAFT_10700 [Bisporella sp. PMI_857]
MTTTMYNLREDLFEMDEEEAELALYCGTEDISSTHIYSETRSKPTSLSFPTFTPPAFEDPDDEIYFPSYEDDSTHSPISEIGHLEPLIEASRPISSPSIEPLALLARPEDDTAARIQPSRHVDYLSHEWSEEDIWSSWKFIVSNRKVLSNSVRLENASWRTWEKNRRQLKTISSETVRWFRDYDTTWLYGPLQPGLSSLDLMKKSEDGPELSLAPPSPIISILKKRSLSQRMLQQSMSSVSLRKQVLEGIETRKYLEAAFSSHDSITSPNTPALTSSPPTELNSDIGSPFRIPWNNSKSVRFHESVGQCIALPHVGEDDQEDPYINESSDDDVIMMRRTMNSPSKPVVKLTRPKATPPPQTIEKLPDVTLKLPGPEKEVEDSYVGLGIRNWTRSPSIKLLSPGLWHEEEDDEEDDEYWRPPKWLQNRKDSVQMFHDKLDAIRMRNDGAENPPPLPQRPNLERRDEAREAILHVSKEPVIEDHDSTVKLELLPCRPQLASFACTGTPREEEQTDYVNDEAWSAEIEFSPGASDYFAIMPGRTWRGFEDHDVIPPRALSPANDAMVDRIMDEFAVVHESMEFSGIDPERLKSLPDLVRKHIENIVRDRREPNERSIIQDMVSIIHTCREQLQSTQAGLDLLVPPGSPRLSSDSGYGSEETGKLLIKDLSRDLIEKEKGVMELYPDAWDELDEALLWRGA